MLLVPPKTVRIFLICKDTTDGVKISPLGTISNEAPNDDISGTQASR